MPSILIVDDSEIDQTLARNLLQTQDQIEDVVTEIVDSARLALEVLETNPPDVVVTDLVMPEIHGLELIDTIRQRFPLVPVIAMTSRGSEEIAVAALEKGASSYVPKHNLASLLVDTIETVLAASLRRRGRANLMRVMVESHASFVLENDRALFRPLLQYLQDTMAEFGLFDETESMRVCVAVEEALNNAAEHGNLELDSSMRERDFRAYVNTMRSRCNEDGYRDRRIHFQAHFSPTESVFEIRDEGRGFDRSALPDPTAAENLDSVSGRGLTLMRTFMDDVEFNDEGNCVRMVKRGTSD